VGIKLVGTRGVILSHVARVGRLVDVRIDNHVDTVLVIIWSDALGW